MDYYRLFLLYLFGMYLVGCSESEPLSGHCFYSRCELVFQIGWLSLTVGGALYLISPTRLRIGCSEIPTTTIFMRRNDQMFLITPWGQSWYVLRIHTLRVVQKWAPSNVWKISIHWDVYVGYPRKWKWRSVGTWMKGKQGQYFKSNGDELGSFATAGEHFNFCWSDLLELKYYKLFLFKCLNWRCWEAPLRSWLHHCRVD